MFAVEVKRETPKFIYLKNSRPPLLNIEGEFKDIALIKDGNAYKAFPTFKKAFDFLTKFFDTSSLEKPRLSQAKKLGQLIVFEEISTGKFRLAELF